MKEIIYFFPVLFSIGRNSGKDGITVNLEGHFNLQQKLPKSGSYFMEKFLTFGLLFLITQSLLAQGSLDSGLVAFWPFSRNANDSTGHGHNGTAVGAILTQDRFGRDSMAYDFNGTTSEIQVADDPAWAFGQQPFTILLWANFRVVNHLYYIIGQSNGGGSTNKWMIWYSPNSLRFHINSPQTGPIWYFNLNWVPDANQWYQMAVTREGNLFSLYIDSSLRSTQVDTHYVRDSNAPLLIGNAESYDARFNGRLDDVRIYNRALSAQEIRSLYSQVLTGLPKESDFPMTFNLSQNYPNPFNPKTVISFQLAVNSYTKLIIYDALGREIESLVNERLKPGIYEVEWPAPSGDASNYPSGVYYYQLTVSREQLSVFKETKKMVLVK